MEQVAEAMGDAERWFQLYWPKDREVARSFLGRARAAGYTALFVTLDTPLLSWRPRDLDQAYLPFLHGVGTANYFSDPAFRRVWPSRCTRIRTRAVMHFRRLCSRRDPSPSPLASTLVFLRENWDGPIVLKGVRGLPRGDAIGSRGDAGTVSVSVVVSGAAAAVRRPVRTRRRSDARPAGGGPRAAAGWAP
ncbi:L-lactate dehydrogenase [Streptomyces violaceorubidus]